MKKIIRFLLLAYICISILIPALCSAAGFANMSSSVYRLYNGSTGTLGGDAAGANSNIIASNMNPVQQSSDLSPWYQKAQDSLNAAKNFRTNSLVLTGVFANSSTARGIMLVDPKQNYETTGILSGLSAIESQLVGARNTFAYDVSIGYPFEDPSQSQANLLDSIKTLANIYLMIADEFLIDGLEFRFSSDTLGIDQKLDEQIVLLQKAQSYYEKAIDSFVYGFSPAVGTNIYAADYFDSTVYSLFNLAVERLSITLREKSSKILVRQMAPDALQEWTPARTAALDSLKQSAVTSYALAVATAKRLGPTFADFGGDSLKDAMDTLRKQGNISFGNLNPLGYDNRYVPMNDYQDLYNLASAWLMYAKEAKNDLDSETREFDADVDSLRNELNALNSRYIESLATYTGCSAPDTADTSAFETCTGEAGGDLYACSILDSAGFETCMTAAVTKGELATKYRGIRQAQSRLELARLTRQNILERIKNENEKNLQSINIVKTGMNAQAVALDAYLDRLKNARTETDTITITTSKKKEGSKWVDQSKVKEHSTVTTFNKKDPNLLWGVQKEKDFLKVTTDLQIQQTTLDTAYRIKDLLLSEAEAEIEVDLASQQKNTALADYDNTLAQKETLWNLYEKGLAQINDYYTNPDKFASQRILKSEASINLAEAINYTAHYAYLASKALEYKYLKPIVDEPVAGGRLRLTDLFKAQTPPDLEEFLLKLNSLNTQNCPWGTFDPQYNTISLAYHILGLTDGFLDPDGNGLTDDGKTLYQARKDRVQAFLLEHLSNDGKLQFPFSLSEENSFLGTSGLYNMKIWNGVVSSPCDQLVSDVKGVSVTLQTTQTSNIRPKVLLQQSGHSSLRTELGDIAEYIPVSEYHFLFEGSGDYSPSKQAEVIASVNVDPRFQTNTGTWSGAFKGRGITSSQWQVTVFDWNAIYPKTDFSKITDVMINLDTIGECCHE